MMLFSHLNLLRKLERDNVENALIIEDDIKFVKNFKKVVNNQNIFQITGILFI